jgi:ribonuclease BN (tRNA processing enzyme)
VQLTVIGSSPAWPNPGGAHSGYLVESNGKRLLVDCGPGVLPRLRKHETWPKLDAIAISHFHLDHWGDLVPWVWGSMYLNGQPGAVTLFIPPDGGEVLTELGARLGFPDMFERVFAIQEYVPNSAFEVGRLSVTPIRVPHYSIQTYAFRVQEGDTVLAYSGDSAPSAELVDAARDADLFVCEATLRTGADDGELRGHLSVDEAVAAFEQSGARRLLLTHRPSELPVPDGLELAYDGLELSV